jgi:16S rRNA processing protein RimM
MRNQALTNKMIVMGRIGGPFGIKGWIKVQPFTGGLDGLLEHQGWWLGRDGRWERIQVEDGAVHGRTLIAKLQGCEDRQAAARLKGLEIAIPRDQLPASADGEYYWSDLIGLEVANREGVALGRIARLIETGASPVLVVEGERERLIPFAQTVIVSVNLADRRLTVDWGADY